MTLAALADVGLRPRDASVAIQGFGKVGLGAARLLHQAGARVVAVSDQCGAAHRAEGLDIAALEAHIVAHGSVVGFVDSEPIADKELLLELDVSVLIPAAVESVINDRNAGRVRARIIVEGANGPTTAMADDILNQAGVLVVPDILANAGGVVVSYFEWVQANQAYWWRAQEVEQRLEERMKLAWNRVSQHARAHNLTLRTAATSLAVKTVAEAHRARGLYP